MKKIFIAVVVGSIIGSLLTSVVLLAYKKNINQKDLATLWSSEDTSSLSKAAGNLAKKNLNIDLLTQVLSENKNGGASSQAKLIVLETLDEYFVYDLVSLALAQGAARDPDRDVRSLCIDKYDSLLEKTACTHMNLILMHLDSEEEANLLRQKLDLLCKWTYIDRNMIENVFIEKGLEEVKTIMLSRLRENQ